MCPLAGFEGDAASYRTPTGEKPETVRIWLVASGSRWYLGSQKAMSGALRRQQLS